LNFKRSDDTFADVAFGSAISIRHFNTQGGYLHSHPHMYPGGSTQQQVTLYPHRDDNNIWIISNQTEPEIPTNKSGIFPSYKTNIEPVYIKDGAIIRLLHNITERRVHSHDVKAPVSENDWQYEVSAYGYPGFEGDANDWFRVEIVKSHSDKGPARQRLRYYSSFQD
jgi:dolichyl-phosphate-mannose-protein mannosyltransferase